MLQFLFVLLRNPVFLLGIATFIAIAYYYNRLVKAYAHVEETLEQLGNTLKKRRPMLLELAHLAQTHAPDLAIEIDQLHLPENMPVLKDDLAVRFEEESDLSTAWTNLVDKMEREARVQKNDAFQLAARQARSLETEVLGAQQAYNAAARAFNLQTDSFPSGLIASILNVRRQELFV